MLLAYGGLEFQDNRISDEDWPQFKPHTPFGMMPSMLIDEKAYAHSKAMCRYLGRKYGLSGIDIEQGFEIDQIVELIQDLSTKGSHARYEENSEVKAKRHALYSKEVYPIILQSLDESIKKNKG